MALQLSCLTYRPGLIACSVSFHFIVGCLAGLCTFLAIMSMQPDENTLRALNDLLLKLRDPQQLKAATEQIESFYGKPGFAITLIHYIAMDTLPTPMRLQGATTLFTYVKKQWAKIPEGERESLKAGLPDMLLKMPIGLRRVLQETILRMAEYDYQRGNWPKLIPDLVSKLNSSDSNVVTTVLKLIHTVFKHFRHERNVDSVLIQLVDILKTIQEPLLGLFQMSCKQLVSHKDNEQAQLALITTMKLLANIFYSLASVDLPEHFEDNLETYMSGFHFIIQFKSQFKSVTENKDDDEQPGLLSRTQIVIFQIFYLFMEKYEEEFEPFLKRMLQDIWSLIMSLSSEAKYDLLAVKGMDFLSSIARSVYFNIFSQPQTLADICEKIVVPSIKLGERDLYLFEDDPKAYVERDVEGASQESRRGSAMDLVSGLRKHYEGEVTKIFATYINNLLQGYSADSNKWRDKEAAIYLLIALANTRKSQQGVLVVNEGVPIRGFYDSQIFPELDSPVDKQAILQASCLNFVTQFRRHFSMDDYQKLFPIFLKFLQSKSEVVRSQACLAITHFLSIRDPIQNEKGQDTGKYNMRFGRDHIKSLLEPLLSGLFKLFSEDSGENPYLMWAISKVLSVSKQDAAPFLNQSVRLICTKLEQIYQHPNDGQFGHYLFESLAACINANVMSASPGDRAKVLDNYEGFLFPVFQKILTEPDADTFAPFVFQLMSLLIETRGALSAEHPTLQTRAGTLKPVYRQLLHRLTENTMWYDQGNIPALTRLVQAYIEHDPAFVCSENYLVRILGCFQALAASPKNDFLGFYLLQSLILALPLDAMKNYVTEIFKVIFTRLANPKSKTLQLVKNFLLFLCYFMSKAGPDTVAQMVNSIQPDIFAMVLEKFWLTTITRVSGELEHKACVCGTAMLVTQCNLMLTDNYSGLWARLLACEIRLIEHMEDEVNYEAANVDEVFVTSSAFTPLANAPKEPVDTFASISQPEIFFAQKLHELSKMKPGVIGRVVNQLDDQLKQPLQQYLMKAKIPEPYFH